MASAAVMDVITEDPLTLVKNAVMGVPTYCETHAQLVRGDLAHTGSIHNAAVKIKAFWAQYQQLNCVRTYTKVLYIRLETISLSTLLSKSQETCVVRNCGKWVVGTRL